MLDWHSAPPPSTRPRRHATASASVASAILAGVPSPALLPPQSKRTPSPSLTVSVGPCGNANEQLSRLKQAKELAAANMTPEAAAASMTPEEAKRLSMVRNIGIAVRGPSAPSGQDET